MPLYDFRCQKCKQVFEIRLSLREREKGVVKPCPSCGSHTVQQFFGSVGYFRLCRPTLSGGFT